jgi:hypothetical protein
MKTSRTPTDGVNGETAPSIFAGRSVLRTYEVQRKRPAFPTKCVGTQTSRKAAATKSNPRGTSLRSVQRPRLDFA